MKALAIAGIGLILVATVIGTVWLLDSWNVDFQYKKSIGSPMSNAYDAATLQVMLDNLNKSVQGMHDQGLLSTDCGKAFSWEQTPDWCMAYQYQYLDSLKGRIQFYITSFAKNGTSQFTD